MRDRGGVLIKTPRKGVKNLSKQARRRGCHFPGVTVAFYWRQALSKMAMAVACWAVWLRLR
jgi:hypothetical protein